MRGYYEKQVELLLDVLPIVNKSRVFALKGGTAINFFFRNCPRLSVDIDLHYLPDKNREEALADILNALQVIKSDIEKALPGANIVIDSIKHHASVQYNNVLIKIEPNTVIRGTLLPAVEMPLCSFLAKEFNREMIIRCVAKEELFAGKLCAALQRQHPRDLFDVLLLLNKEDGLSRSLLDAFIVYVISQGKPINEMLNPNMHDIENLFINQFQGMTKMDAIGLEDLLQVQKNLPQEILNLFTQADKTFIVGFKKGEPDWHLIAHPHAKALPAVRWKQVNLQRMESQKYQQAIEKLEAVLNRGEK